MSEIEIITSGLPNEEENDWDEVPFIPARKSNLKKYVLEIVSENGLSLQYASCRLRDDRDVVLAAVSNHGGALQFASERLREDPEIVMIAKKNSRQRTLFDI